MNNKKFLSDINIGETAIISSLDIHGSLRRRLQDIGLIEGTLVQCVFKSPFGDPGAYRIRGALIALREADTQNINIKNI